MHIIEEIFKNDKQELEVLKAVYKAVDNDPIIFAKFLEKGLGNPSLRASWRRWAQLNGVLQKPVNETAMRMAAQFQEYMIYLEEKNK